MIEYHAVAVMTPAYGSLLFGAAGLWLRILHVGPSQKQHHNPRPHRVCWILEDVAQSIVSEA